MFIELHILQNFVPSNLNRDDTGSPKDCIFGGVRRARISSQCLKRAIRNAPSFADTTQVESGVRTKYLVQQLKKSMAAERPETEAVLTDLITKLYAKFDKGKSSVLLYISPSEQASMIQSVNDNWEKLVNTKQREVAVGELVKALQKEFKDRTSAPDIALFGRMLAEYPELNINAACQVAHALSTHRVSMEMDYFTAVDDLKQEFGAEDDKTGAAMIGFTSYDSACYYRYARVDWDQLVENLDRNQALARRTVEAFLRASIEAIPTGKQNSHAAYNPPSLVLAVVRQSGMAWSLANAFERSTKLERDSGYLAPSVKALDEYWNRLCTVYGEETIATAAVLTLETDLPLVALNDHRVTNQKAWLETILMPLPGREASI